KSGFNPRIILYIAGGIGGVIFLGCAGMGVASFVRGFTRGFNEARAEVRQRQAAATSSSTTAANSVSGSPTLSPGDDVRKALAGEWLPLRADTLFTIDFTPGRSARPPSSFTSESLSGVAGEPLVKFYEQSEGNAKYTLKAGYTHEPVQQQVESAASALDRLVQSLTANNYPGYTATIASSSETALGEHPGREVEVRTTVTSSGRTIQSTTRIRLYVVAGRVFWLECKAVSPNPFPEQDYRKFVDSFKLL
ncbi:MAG: hypothetical protein ABI614_06760, partial [Planctomycetota bacterium]